MQKFNLKKFATVATQEERLEDDRKNRGYVPTTEGLLSDNRKGEGDGVATEKLLSKARTNKPAEITIEGQMEKAEVPDGYPQRDGKNQYDQLPINLLAEARDQEKAKAFEKAADLGNNTKFWDNFIGTQLDGDETKVPSQIDGKASQLHNRSERFTGLTEDNQKVDKMVMASLKDADAMLYYIYHKAAVEERDLLDDEKELVAGINNDKAQLLIRLGKGGHLCSGCKCPKWECKCTDKKDDGEEEMVDPIRR